MELSVSETRKYLQVPLRVHFRPPSRRLAQGQPGHYFSRNISDNRGTAETRTLDPRMEVVMIMLMDAALRVTPEFLKEEDSLS